MADALSALLGLQSAQAPLLGLEDMRKRRLLEMERNRELTAGNPHAAVGATNADIASLKSDISQDPTTGDYADQQVVYQSPFETQKRDVARQDALAKLLMPGKQAMDLERLRQEGAMSLQKEKNAGQTAIGDLFTPEGQQVAADVYAQTGKMVPGMTRSPQTLAGVVNRLGETQPGINVAANEAEYAGNKMSYGALQKSLDAATAFSKTADDNSKLLQAAMQQVPDLGSPMLNTPVRGVYNYVFGDPTINAMKAVRQSVSREYNRLLENPNLTGVITESSKHAIDDILDPNGSVEQVNAALQQLQSESRNRVNSFQSQLGVVSGRLRGTAAPTQAPQYLSGSGWE